MPDHVRSAAWRARIVRLFAFCARGTCNVRCADGATSCSRPPFRACFARNFPHRARRSSCDSSGLPLMRIIRFFRVVIASIRKLRRPATSAGVAGRPRFQSTSSGGSELPEIMPHHNGKRQVAASSPLLGNRKPLLIPDQLNARSVGPDLSRPSGTLSGQMCTVHSRDLNSAAGSFRPGLRAKPPA